MKKLTIEEKIKIANAGGHYEEEHNSWIGVLIRKGGKHGEIIRDENGRYRILTVRFQDGVQEEIRLNNVGPDSSEVHAFEYYSITFNQNKWYRF